MTDSVSYPLLLKFGLFLYRRKWLNNSYITFLLILIIAGYVYSTYGRFTTIYLYIHPVLIFIDQATYVILSVANIVSCTSYYRHGDIYLMVICEDWDKKYGKIYKNKLRKYAILFYVVVWYLVFIDGLFFLKTVGWSCFKYYMHRDWLFFSLCIIVFVLALTINKITEMFSDVNYLLETMSTAYFTQPVIKMPAASISSLVANKNIYYDEKLNTIIKQYNRVCDLLDGLNESLGLVILFCIVYIICNIWWCLIVIVEFFVRKNTFNGVDISVWILVVYMSWLITTLVLATFLAVTGANIDKENERALKLCCTMANRMIASRHYSKIKMKLDYFMDLMVARKPLVNAGGFLQLNLTTLGVIVSNVTTYSIVSIQFVLKDGK
ncbi:uncharacterized protein LOC143203360 [Rhynchophorus ferrugineus]|uniref:uncharacterized protein LOC143203360 n=1 Tax=Rhynchophorus ferrugineus TaxID=354439 RepID=UPI003FCCC18E